MTPPELCGVYQRVSSEESQKHKKPRVVKLVHRDFPGARRGLERAFYSIGGMLGGIFGINGRYPINRRSFGYDPVDLFQKPIEFFVAVESSANHIPPRDR
jgi:hypothetical protein